MLYDMTQTRQFYCILWFGIQHTPCKLFKYADDITIYSDIKRYYVTPTDSTSHKPTVFPFHVEKLQESATSPSHSVTIMTCHSMWISLVFWRSYLKNISLYHTWRKSDRTHIFKIACSQDYFWNGRVHILPLALRSNSPPRLYPIIFHGIYFYLHFSKASCSFRNFLITFLRSIYCVLLV